MVKRQRKATRPEETQLCNTAKRTDTVSGDITVTNTTDYVILAGMKSFRGVVETTCAVMEWSVYLDDVAKLCLEEL